MPESDEDGRTFLQHVEELRIRIIRILVSIVAISIFAFSFSVGEVEISGTRVPVPYPNLYNNIASQTINSLKEAMLPSYVQVIVTTPGQAILAQLYAAIMIGVIASIPIMLREVVAFLSPGLYPHEKKLIRNLAVPSTILFILGSLFAVFFMIPFTIDFLYRYGLALEVQTFITIDELISFFSFFIIAFGLSFQLPVLMWVLSRLGVVGPGFWRTNWRYTFIALVIFSAVITPDGSGVTMWFIALPMMALYLVGYLWSKSATKTNGSAPKSQRG